MNYKVMNKRNLFIMIGGVLLAALIVAIIVTTNGRRANDISNRAIDTSGTTTANAVMSAGPMSAFGAGLKFSTDDGVASASTQTKTTQLGSGGTLLDKINAAVKRAEAKVKSGVSYKSYVKVYAEITELKKTYEPESFTDYKEPGVGESKPRWTDQEMADYRARIAKLSTEIDVLQQSINAEFAQYLRIEQENLCKSSSLSASQRNYCDDEFAKKY